MNKQVLSVLKYLISLSLAIGLFYFIYKDQDKSDLFEKLSKAKPVWLIASALAVLFSHWSRACRWAIALKPLGYQPNKLITFMAVIIGYFANVFVPRLGEVARCTVLKQTEDVPVNTSFGAVVTERVLDLIILIILTVVTFLIEFDKIGKFVIDQFQASSDQMTGKIMLLAGLGIAFLGFILVLYLLRERIMKMPFYEKVKTFLMGMKDGLLSIKRLDNTAKAYYLLHTINIWVMYYVMTYVLFFSLDVTSNLSMMCALTVLIMGGVGMALPSPGGIGTYHALVGSTLIAYGLSDDIGKQFALLMHGVQTSAILVLGALALLLVFFISKRKKTSPTTEKTSS